MPHQAKREAAMRCYPAIAFMLGFALLASCSQPVQPGDHTTDSLETVKQNLESEEALLVDVREESEWESSGHVAGAVLLPTSELKQGIDREELSSRLPEDKVLYTYCAAGKRAVTAGKDLQNYGFEVRPLKAGYEELVEAGFEEAEY